MKISLKKSRRFLPADAKPPEVLKPADSPFDGPSAYVTAKRSTILRPVFWLTVCAVWCDHLDAFVRQRVVETITVIRFITHNVFRPLFGQHEIKEALHQSAFVGCRGHGIDRDRRAACINKNHYFHAFSYTCTANTIASATGFAEGAIDKTFVEAILSVRLDKPSSIAHDVLKNAVADPRLKPTVKGTLRSELGRKIFPLGSVVENPEDAAHNFALIDRGSSAQRITRSVWDSLHKPIELLLCKL